MLTVKHINIRGDEKLFEVMDVRFIKAKDQHSCGAPELGPTRMDNDYVILEIGEERMEGHCYGGTVFVMNRHGSTVSRYDLGASHISLSTDPATFGQAIGPAMTERKAA